jgi:RecJ-like exonuclease
MTHSDGGKGSARRPGEGYQDNWDRIFGGRKRQIAEAVAADNEDDDEEHICPTCNGSGEGMYDGSRCYKCKGTGDEPTEKEIEP